MDTTMLVGAIVTFALGIGGVGKFVGKLTKRTDEVELVLKELLEALSKTSSALKDGNLTAEETKQIIKEFKDVVDAAKKAF